MGALIVIVVMAGGVWLLLRYLDRSGSILDPEAGKREVEAARRRSDAIARSGPGTGRAPSSGGRRQTVTVYSEGEVVHTADMDVYEEAAPYLRLQVASGSYGMVDPASLVTWELADGLKTVLAFDLAGGETNVDPAYLERWDVPLETIRATALDNSAGDAFGELEQYRLSDGDGDALLAEFMSSPSNYTAAAGLRVLGQLASEGVQSVFALPSWCNFLHRELDGTQTAAGLGKLAKAAAALFDEAATPGVRGLYWHRDGDFVPVTFDEADGTFRLTGPAELVERCA